ncbi:integral membrane protein [Podospora appendiculata]|uniref:Integral membrane protein n=1 Tax=Podospora appendiculata TaxID=314037 RepID=A0AAE1C8W6_9PEZI|nr:integral membrane protein [Podospora appendiculata]
MGRAAPRPGRLAATVASSLSPARSTRASKTARWDDGIPPLLRPLVRAYLLGYASTVAPRLITLLLKHLTHRRHTEGGQPQPQPSHHKEPFLAALARILRGGLDWQRFPTFCAAIVGGSTLLAVPLRAIFDRLAGNLSLLARQRLSRWFATFTAGYLSLLLLQSKPLRPSSSTDETQPTSRAGRTLDLTLFAFTRALDATITTLWRRRRPATKSPLTRLADPLLFALSSSLIMWAWFYYPARLPPSYQKWISSAAAVDPRLILALRGCHAGTLRYGVVDPAQAALLGGMCADLGLPPAWGDPAVAVPFPCTLVHMGHGGASCEAHALWRFARSARWALGTYLPLAVVLAVSRRAGWRGILKAVASSARSSAFLGAFVALFYYGVCLARTRLGPRVLGTAVAVRQAIDGGLCVASGCLLCGWSVLVEKPGRRGDMALFVAPRALATLLPRRYALEKQWRETVVFAASTAVVFTITLEQPGRVRGVLGGVLGSVLVP